jgi:hypothetical protein
MKVCGVEGAADAQKSLLLGHNSSDDFHAVQNGPRLAFVDDFGGAKRDRTADLLVANEALSQLSYSPTRWEQPQLF